MASRNGNVPAICIQGGFQKITVSEGHFRKKTLEKGKNIVQAGHVGGVSEEDSLVNVEERRTTGQVQILGSVAHSTSVKEAPYHVEFKLNPQDRSVIEAHCSCVAGLSGNCKHCAALFIFINTERTTGCADQSQAWNVPSKKLQKCIPRERRLNTFYFVQKQLISP